MIIIRYTYILYEKFIKINSKFDFLLKLFAQVDLMTITWKSYVVICRIIRCDVSLCITISGLYRLRLMTRASYDELFNHKHG